MATLKAPTQIVEALAEPDLRDTSTVGPERPVQPNGDSRLGSAAGNGAPHGGSKTARRRITGTPKARSLGKHQTSAASQRNGLPLVDWADGGTHPPFTEVELKLLVEPEQLTALIDSPPIVAHAHNKGTVRLLTDIYYDTPAGALRSAGTTLRVRQFGKRFVQTVKMASAEASLPLGRGEWESPVAGMAPDLQALTPLMSMDVQDALARDPLRPIFTTELRRRLRTLTLPSGTVEVAFDTGVIKSGERTAPICEIEIEIKSGSPAALYDLALLISEYAAVRPTTRSKADRGFDLAFEMAPAAHGPRRLHASGEVSLDDAFAQFLRSALQQLVLNQPAAEDGRNPEGVHQLRIALRRLRCALSMLRLLAPSAKLESLGSDAKWLASTLAAARNWDVFLGETLPDVAQACSTVAGFDLMREIAEQTRHNGYVVARAALADGRVGRFELALGAWIEQRGWRCDVSGDHLSELSTPAIAFATRALAKQHNRVIKRGRHFKRLPLEALHDLRLAVKKLRYTSDFFLPLFGEDRTAKRYARRLSRLQERLGRYNDSGTTRDLTAELALDALPAAGREALGAVLGWQACRLANAETEARAAWWDFRDAQRPWVGRRGG